MRDHPSTSNLLATARRALLSAVAPHLEGDALATAIMVARALSVSAARTETGMRDVEEEYRCLCDLLGERSEQDIPPEELEREVMRLGRRLSSAIRAGSFDRDRGQHDQLFQYLVKVTRSKVAENNPKALDIFG